MVKCHLSFLIQWAVPIFLFEEDKMIIIDVIHLKINGWFIDEADLNWMIFLFLKKMFFFTEGLCSPPLSS